MVSLGSSSTESREGFIPVYEPDLTGNERKYVLDCVDTGWVSSIGIYTKKFEEELSRYLGIPHCIVVANGTVALHLSLHCLGIGPGDEVIVPTFTYIAPINMIIQTGARVVFAECRREDWLVDPEDVRRKITPRTRAILPIHLFGSICDMDAILSIASAHGIAVVEDCAESFGSTFDGRHTGSFGDVGTFSFFGNKTITTGEGGMVATNDDRLAARLRKVKGQGQSLTRRYWHDEMGFNYRMTNICAAIGCAQLERIESILERKRQIAELYRFLLRDTPVVFQQPRRGLVSSNWLISLLLPSGVDRDRLASRMQDAGVDSRPVFYCAHQLPMYASKEVCLPTAEDISRRGISLPSYPGLMNGDVERVVKVLRESAGF